MIDVVDDDPGWPQLFELLRDSYERVLAGVAVVGIEHVGSTSVPGLAGMTAEERRLIQDANRAP